MVTVTSKIKTMFPGDLLRYIAAICDTRRIESNAQKMITLGNLLFTHGIDFEILGGATNRIALQIDGYAVKFAMDEQGYVDNLVEYSLSPELQPYVTKSYETNGYILVAECVEVINTKDKWEYYRYEIRKILDAMCQDYLLGDVGYIPKNMTNWGIRNGRPVILDYAYCHRATENLFTCSKCGAVLTYDSSYDILMCSDRSGCHARYTYNERKRIQGKQVDIDMIRERKADSICLPKNIITKNIEVFEDRLVGDNLFVIDTPGDMHRYLKLKEDGVMRLELNVDDGFDTDMDERFDALIDLAMSGGSDKNAANIVFRDFNEEPIPEPVYTDNYRENYMDGNNSGIYVPDHIAYGEDLCEGDEDDDTRLYADEDDFDALINLSLQKQQETQRAFEEAKRAQEDAYLEKVRKREAEQAAKMNIRQQEDTSASGLDKIVVTETEPEESKEDVQECEELVSETTEENETEPLEEEPVFEEPTVEESESEPEDVIEDRTISVNQKNAGGERSPSIFVNGKPLNVGETVVVSNEVGGDK